MAKQSDSVMQYSPSATALKSNCGSVSLAIQDCRAAGEDASTSLLFQRYFKRLAWTLKGRVNHRLQATAGADEAALRVLEDILTKLAAGGYADLTNRESFWALLIHAGEKRVQQDYRQAAAQKRDFRRTHALEFHESRDDGTRATLDPVSREPAPEFVAELDDMVAHIVSRLTKPVYRELFFCDLEGADEQETKERIEKVLGRQTAPRSVRRYRQVLRDELAEIYPELVDEPALAKSNEH